VLGAALALRAEAIAAVGGFDESYFMYNEEVDLCLRLARAGWEAHFAPGATVVHVGGASTSQRRAAMAAQYVRSTIALYRRHFSPGELAAVRAIFALTLATRAARDGMGLLLARDPERRRSLQATLRAHVAAGAALRQSSRDPAAETPRWR
jgi:GT2 family glycosyltransferase